MLESARAKLHATFYSIVDRDSGDPEGATPARALSWDVYHIENYLLEPTFIFEALRDALGARIRFKSPEEVDQALRECAALTEGELVRIQLTAYVDRAFFPSIKIGGDARKENLSAQIRESIDGTLQRLGDVTANSLSLGSLQSEERKIREGLKRALVSDEWRSVFRGRDILKRFVSEHGQGQLKYEAFRNLILSRMREAEYRPRGMQNVIDTILNDRDEPKGKN